MKCRGFVLASKLLSRSALHKSDLHLINILINIKEGGSGMDTRRASRRRRPLNLVLIKSLIVFISGTITAFVGAITGLAAQSAFAPMLSWMLGFAPDRAHGTALRYATLASLSAVLTGWCLNIAPKMFLLDGFVITAAAIVGALVAAPLSAKLQTVNGKRWLQTIGILVTLLVIIWMGHLRTFDNPHLEQWNGLLALAGIGFAVGALTQIIGLVGGGLLVPALYFLSGFNAQQSVLISLLVVCLASIVPAWSYSKRGLIDVTYGNATMLAGILGGIGGGLLLVRIHNEKIPIILSAVIVMFLCGRELSKQTGETSVEPNAIS